MYVNCKPVQAKEMMEQRKAARAALSAQLDAQIAEQRAAITKMETELGASGQVHGIRLLMLCPDRIYNDGDRMKPLCQ